MKAPSVGTGFLLAMVVLFYVGSYAVLSLRGGYMCVANRFSGNSSTCWAPQGFLSCSAIIGVPINSDYRGNKFLQVVYGPLWQLDNRYWHSPQF